MSWELPTASVLKSFERWAIPGLQKSRPDMFTDQAWEYRVSFAWSLGADGVEVRVSRHRGEGAAMRLEHGLAFVPLDRLRRRRKTLSRLYSKLSTMPQLLS